MLQEFTAPPRTFATWNAASLWHKIIAVNNRTSLFDPHWADFFMWLLFLSYLTFLLTFRIAGGEFGHWVPYTQIIGLWTDDMDQCAVYEISYCKWMPSIVTLIPLHSLTHDWISKQISNFQVKRFSTIMKLWMMRPHKTVINDKWRLENLMCSDSTDSHSRANGWSFVKLFSQLINEWILHPIQISEKS